MSIWRMPRGSTTPLLAAGLLTGLKEGLDVKNNQSAEDYLEAILIIRGRNGNTRSIDVAHELNVSKPSVSVAMKKLKERNWIEIDENGLITFTDDGEKLAKKVYDKHRLLTKVLVMIGLDESEAAEEACLIEHVISDKTYKCINKYYKQASKKE